MFQVQCLVDDKKLASALKALDGLVHNMQVVPVRNVAVEGKQVKEKFANGNLLHNLIALVKKHKGPLTMEKLKGWVDEVGGGKTTAGYYVQKLFNLKVIKPGKARGTYEKV